MAQLSVFFLPSLQCRVVPNDSHETCDRISKTIKAIPLSKLHQSHHHDQIFSLRSVSGGVFTASDKGVNIDTNNGRLLISLNDYLLRIQLDCPRYVIAMADEVPYTAGKKRLATAVRRSQTWFTQMKEAPQIDWKTSSLIGVIVGKNTQQFQESVVSQTQFLISNGARGILIGGIGLGETLEERRIVINLVKEARGEADCPLFIQGVQTLEEVNVPLSRL
jgi:tRNA-guanine family transglycosylase